MAAPKRKLEKLEFLLPTTLVVGTILCYNFSPTPLSYAAVCKACPATPFLALADPGSLLADPGPLLQMRPSLSSRF